MLKSFVGREDPVGDTRGHGQFSILEGGYLRTSAEISFSVKELPVWERVRLRFSGDNRRENLK